MEVDDLRRTKIYLSNKKDRVQFQESAFKLGIKWRGGETKILNLDYCCYFIDQYLRLHCCSTLNRKKFINSNNTPIFLDDILKMEINRKEICAFKPFDKVLVRDKDNSRWMPRLFSFFDQTKCVYETTDGFAYKQCTPYDEQLANTYLDANCK